MNILASLACLCSPTVQIEYARMLFEASLVSPKLGLDAFRAVFKPWVAVEELNTGPANYFAPKFTPNLDFLAFNLSFISFGNRWFYLLSVLT
jgi:hypothetical protein